MTSTWIAHRYDAALGQHSPELLETLATRVGRFRRSKKPTPPIELLTQQFESLPTVKKLVQSLADDERQALGVFRRLPLVFWRWDHACMLLVANGTESPQRVLQTLLGEGLLYLAPAKPTDTIARWEQPRDCPLGAFPTVGYNPRLLDHDLELPTPTGPTGVAASAAGRFADGWEHLVRLSVLWQLAWQAPIKRTQQDQLFKRDLERLTKSDPLTAPMLDSPLAIYDAPMMTYRLAGRLGWLTDEGGEQTPTGSFAQGWTDDFNQALEQVVSTLVRLTDWSELGPTTPMGTFHQDASVHRGLLLQWLTTLDPESVISVATLAQRLQETLPPWNGVGELVGSMRAPEQRQQLAHKWTESFLLGPLYQTGILELHLIDETPHLRLSPRGRNFVGASAPPAPPAALPGALLVQPNHQILAYRQALSMELLDHLMACCECKGIGGALMFELNARSVFSGLETGMTEERIIQTLESAGGRPIPPNVARSINSWAQKREKLTVYGEASLFEFASETDLQQAIQRGLEGTPITDRILLVANSNSTQLGHLRITSSRDYRLAPAACVQTSPDGASMTVDISKSDLMLAAELARIADPAPSSNGHEVHRVSCDSLRRALQHGMTPDLLEEWFRQRTGDPPPASIRLMLRSAAGLQLGVKRSLILTTDSPQIADGLYQHATTKPFLGDRIGPCAIAIPEDLYPQLQVALQELGVEVHP